MKLSLWEGGGGFYPSNSRRGNTQLWEGGGKKTYYGDVIHWPKQSNQYIFIIPFLLFSQIKIGWTMDIFNPPPPSHQR